MNVKEVMTTDPACCTSDMSLQEVAKMVSKAKGKEVKLEVVDRESHEQYHVQERGMDDAYVKWWAKTYDALRDGECEINDSTLEDLLSSKGVQPKAMEDTVREMFAAASKS